MSAAPEQLVDVHVVHTTVSLGLYKDIAVCPTYRVFHIVCVVHRHILSQLDPCPQQLPSKMAATSKDTPYNGFACIMNSSTEQTDMQPTDSPKATSVSIMSCTAGAGLHACQ